MSKSPIILSLHGTVLLWSSNSEVFETKTKLNRSSPNMMQSLYQTKKVCLGLNSSDNHCDIGCV